MSALPTGSKMAAPISKNVYIFGYLFVKRLKDFIRHDPFPDFLPGLMLFMQMIWLSIQFSMVKIIEKGRTNQEPLALQIE
ncbi:hypothetical protein DPMN_075565 [Dreissena polymorpha]|uniref:Uncharacterized protein n=1 Tax=Dreissena polymorpha TaxID=45954 RepID=A0A9D3YLB5_DREPO|nr:hypothetical protein DPMN_075565 [Dreissena polymorpha]